MCEGLFSGHKLLSEGLETLRMNRSLGKISLLFFNSFYMYSGCLVLIHFVIFLAVYVFVVYCLVCVCVYRRLFSSVHIFTV